VHRDLKCANVLFVDPSRTSVKVADFGLAAPLASVRQSSTTRTGFKGTLAFTSPEAFGGHYSEASDMFAMMVAAFEIVSRQKPWADISDPELLKIVSKAFDPTEKSVARQIRRGTSEAQLRREWEDDYPLSERRPDLSLAQAGCPDDLKRLIERGWSDDPAERPSFVHSIVELRALRHSMVQEPAAVVAAPESGFRCPVGSTGFHVFLSYRRVDAERARAIKLALEAIGYKVFMDITDEGLQGGDFQAQLESHLKSTPVVIALCTATVNPDRSEACEFLRIKNTGDFVRLEIRATLHMKKLLIPIWTSVAPGTPGFDIGKLIWGADLPGDVKGMGSQNMVELSTNYFDASIEKLHKFIEHHAAAGLLDALTSFDGEVPAEPAAATVVVAPAAAGAPAPATPGAGGEAEMSIPVQHTSGGVHIVGDVTGNVIVGDVHGNVGAYPQELMRRSPVVYGEQAVNAIGPSSVKSVAELLDASGAALGNVLEYPRVEFMKLCSDLGIDIVASNLIWAERGTVKAFRTAIGGEANHVSDHGTCVLAVEGSCKDLADVLRLDGASLGGHGEEAAAVLQTRALTAALGAEAAHVEEDGIRNLAVAARCRNLGDALALDRASFGGLTDSGAEAATVLPARKLRAALGVEGDRVGEAVVRKLAVDGRCQYWRDVISVGEAGHAELGTSVVLESFRQADLSGVDLREIQLAGTDLSGSTLTGATLSGMDLRSCVLRDAVLWEADLRGANLKGIIIANPGSFVQSLFDPGGSTQMKIGSSNPVQHWVTTHGSRHAMLDGATIPAAVRKHMASPGTARPLAHFDKNFSTGKPHKIGFMYTDCKHWQDRSYFDLNALGGIAVGRTFRDKSGRAATVVEKTDFTEIGYHPAPGIPYLTVVFEYHDDGSQTTVSAMQTPGGTGYPPGLCFIERMVNEWDLFTPAFSKAVLDTIITES
jgi:uncharacterized protein YjbI with pentapeptide repeats